MAQRRFGPVLGAGVRVEEVEADRPLDEAPLGVTAYVGIFERGTTGKVLSTYSKKGVDKLLGGRIPESLAPDAALDFWEHSQGAGELHCVRVTDGSEVAASITLYARSFPRKAVAKLSASSGGRWGGASQLNFGSFSSSTATVLTTGATMRTNEWAGATLYLDAVAGKSYQVRSNDASGHVTVDGASDLATDIANGTVGATGYTLLLPGNRSSGLAVSVGNGENDAANEWSLNVYLDGNLVKRFPNLSSDPTSANYFVNIVNDDSDNTWVVAEDLIAGGSTPVASDRPSGFWAKVASISDNQITPVLMNVDGVTSSSSPKPNPTVTAGTTTETMATPVRFDVVMSSGTAFTVNELPDDGGPGVAVGTGTLGTPFTPASTHLPPFTLANGSTHLASGDHVQLSYNPLTPDVLVGSLVYPDPTTYPMRGFRISGNTHSALTIGSGDLTHPAGPDGSVADGSLPFTVVAPMPLTGGKDGIAGITDQDYLDMLDPETSPLRALLAENKGLVKLAIPGVTSTTVQQAMLALAEQYNWQGRVEFPDTITSEDDALDFVNTTIGRSDMGKCHLPSYADVANPDKPGTLKRTTLTGMIHGREALIAKNFQGYHKAAAGVDTMYQLPKVLQLPASGLNEEVLNPAGINVVKRNKGRFIMWGDRTIASDPTWKFAHHRELMSHYENQLREGFDTIVFGINDPAMQGQVITSLRAFFLPEWQKRALRGTTLDDAAVIKVDNDVNTDQTRANGDLIAELSLRLADTIERFVIRVGKAGIFESTGT